MCEIIYHGKPLTLTGPTGHFRGRTHLIMTASGEGIELVCWMNTGVGSSIQFSCE
jgi:hypothetical protein